MALADTRKRARSEGEKERRRAAILEAAKDYVAEQGFDAVTMSGLAARAGLAKGTLYLYVRSKEELFLALFVAAMEDFVIRFEAEATGVLELPEMLSRIAVETPLFLPLYARLVTVIEANVADAPLFCAKRQIGMLGDRFNTHLVRLLDVGADHGASVTSALMLAMQGAAQFDLTAQRDPATLPDDLKLVFASHTFTERFPEAARVILSGFL